jgi:hypothetical protein
MRNFRLTYSIICVTQTLNHYKIQSHSTTTRIQPQCCRSRILTHKPFKKPSAHISYIITRYWVAEDGRYDEACIAGSTGSNSAGLVSTSYPGVVSLHTSWPLFRSIHNKTEEDLQTTTLIKLQDKYASLFFKKPEVEWFEVGSWSAHCMF